MFKNSDERLFSILLFLRKEKGGRQYLSPIDDVVKVFKSKYNEEINTRGIADIIRNFSLRQKNPLSKGVLPFDFRINENSHFTHIGLIDRAYNHPEEWSNV